MHDSQRANGSSVDDEGLVRAACGEADALMALMASTVAAPDGGRRPAIAPDSVPGYELLGEIHHGGQGVVYRAVHKTTKRRVAVKVMRDGPFATPRERARFEREVEILGRLRHPNIVTVHDSGALEGNAYFVMDYIAGQPLDVHMAGRDHSIEETLQLFARICETVDAAHVNGIIHRDLKPSNVRIDAAGEPHVLDFGLARLADDETIRNPKSEIRNLTVTGQFVGSLPWASPEQVAGLPGKIDLRTDVYSLGVVLFQMLTRRFPYEVVGPMNQVMRNILQAEPARPRSVRRQIDDEVETMILKCLRKERERRYQTAGELARDVRRYLRGEPIEAKRDSMWYYLTKSMHRYRVHLAAAAVLLTLGVSMAVRSSRQVAAAEEARLAEQKFRIAAQNQALVDQEKSLKDRGFLTFLLGRVIAGEPPRDEKLQAVQELLASLGERLRHRTIEATDVGDLARVLLDLKVRGRKLTGLGIDPKLSIRIGTRTGFWVPQAAQVVMVDAFLDGVPLPDPQRVAELAGGAGEASMGFSIDAGSALLVKGEHVLTGSCRVRFIERPEKTDEGNYARGLVEPLETLNILAECELPIPPFRFTVAEGIETPLAVNDEGLAAVTRGNLVFEGLTWFGGKVADEGFWKLKVRFGRPFAYLAFNLEVRDAEERLLAGMPVVVDREGKAHVSGAWATFEVDGRTWSEINLEPAATMPRDADGLPIVAPPVTIRLSPSRAAALDVPEVDAYLAFEMSAEVPLDLHPMPDTATNPGAE